MKILAALAVTLIAFPAPAQQEKEQVSETLKVVRRRIEMLRKGKMPSTSLGTRGQGGLRHAVELEEKGIGYRITRPERKTHFGTDELVFGLMEVGAHVSDRFGESGAFLVGDLSAKDGGFLERHINHQGGRDADLGMYACDQNGRPQGSRFMTFDKDGRGTGTMRFDVARNWEFVCLMLENPYFQDMHNILVADWLKKLMLDHARLQQSNLRTPEARARLQALIEKAEKKLRQPKSSPHDNHFHLALACTAEDRKGGCRD